MSNNSRIAKLVASVFVVGLLTVLSCRKPPEEQPVTQNGTLTVHFDVKFNGQPFALYTPYYDVTYNYRIQAELLKFIMYKLTLKKNDGTEMMIQDAKIVNISSDHYSFALQVEPASYQGLKFGIGVGDSTVNHGDPAVYAATHALSYNGSADMHWTWNTGYIFLKLEGRADTTTNGTGSLNQLFALHTGDDPLYGEVNLYGNPFSVTASQNTDFRIDVDVAKFFYSATDTIDIKTENATHSNNQLSVKFSQIYLNAFSAQ